MVLEIGPLQGASKGSKILFQSSSVDDEPSCVASAPLMKKVGVDHTPREKAMRDGTLAAPKTSSLINRHATGQNSSAPSPLTRRFGRWSLVWSSRPGAFSSEDLEGHVMAWSHPRALTAMINWYRTFLPYPAVIVRAGSTSNNHRRSGA